MVTERLGRYAVLSADPHSVREIAGRLDAAQVGSHREYELWQGRVADEAVTIISTGIGSPSLAIAIEELSRAGVDTILAAGQAHSVADDTSEAWLAFAAVRQDGTGVQYLPIEFPAVADPGLVRVVLRAACQAALPVRLGLVRSNDAFYGPTLHGTALRESSGAAVVVQPGVLCADLSTAAHFVVASALGIRAAALLHAAGSDRRVSSAFHDLVAASLLAIVSSDRKVRE